MCLQRDFTFLLTWALWIEETMYNPLCDANEKSISDMLNDDIDINSDDEMDLEIEGENASEESSTKCQKVKVKVRVKQVLLLVDGWATRKPRHTHLLKMQGHNLNFCQMKSQ
jgi:hypothetical protein